jgi:hypothetical protein
VLATTVSPEVCTDAEILQAYQEQHTTVEPGFRMLSMLGVWKEIGVGLALLHAYRVTLSSRASVWGVARCLLGTPFTSRAEPRHGADCLQRPLLRRSRLRQRLMPGVS